MLPVEVTVTAPAPLALIPYALAPVVVMPNAPVLLVMVMSPSETKLIPGVPLAGAMAWVKVLTLRVVTGGAVKSAVPPMSVIPADWLPVQVATAPNVVQATGPASAG